MFECVLAQLWGSLPKESYLPVTCSSTASLLHLGCTRNPRGKFERDVPRGEEEPFGFAQRIVLAERSWECGHAPILGWGVAFGGPKRFLALTTWGMYSLLRNAQYLLLRA